MKRSIKSTVIAGVAGILLLGTANAVAQDRGGRGGFDPEEMRQRMMDGIRERLEITSNDEWKAIQPLVEKVLAARREAQTGNVAAFGGGRGGRGGQGGQGGDGERRRGGGGGGAGFGGFGGGEPSPEAQALQRALESKASADELKTRIAKVREARKEKEAALEKAEEDLRKVLTVRQEAISVRFGYLR